MEKLDKNEKKPTIMVNYEEFHGNGCKGKINFVGNNVPIHAALAYGDFVGTSADQSMLVNIIEQAIIYDWLNLNKSKEFSKLFHWLFKTVTCNYTQKFIISYKFLDIVCIVFHHLPKTLTSRDHNISYLNKIFNYVNKSKWCQWQGNWSYMYRHPPTYYKMYSITVGVVVEWNSDFKFALGQNYVTKFKKYVDDKNHQLHKDATELKKFIQNIHDLMVQSCHDIRDESFDNFKDYVMQTYIKEMRESKQEEKDQPQSWFLLVDYVIDFDNFQLA